jgi:hypothetical protein
MTTTIETLNIEQTSLNSQITVLMSEKSTLQITIETYEAQAIDF